MRAVGYYRYSDEDGSLRVLEDAFVEFCDLNLHQPVKTFGDSIGPAGPDRPQYRQMVSWMRQSGSSFLVVIPESSHLGDDLESVARTLVELDSGEAKVTCADEDYPDPIQNAFHTLGVKGVSRTRSDRIKESMVARALEGKGLGKPPYGYRIGSEGRLSEVQEEADVVKLIFLLYTHDGLGLRLIAQNLNERGLATRRGGKWNIVTIRDILRNHTYMGTYTRFGLRVPKSHPAIVPPELFRAAQDETMSRRPGRRTITHEPFLLSRLVHCGYCGNKMMGVTRRQTWKKKDGNRSTGVYRYYQCQSRNNLGVCRYHTWRAGHLEEEVLSRLKKALHDLSKTRGGDGASGDVPTAQDALQDDARTRNAERSLLEAMRRASRGEVSIRALGGYLEQLDAARVEASAARGPVDARDTLTRWEDLDVTSRQRFLAGYVERIVVRDDKVNVKL